MRASSVLYTAAATSESSQASFVYLRTGWSASKVLAIAKKHLYSPQEVVGIAGSQKLEFMFSKLSNYHCKELPVAKA